MFEKKSTEKEFVIVHKVHADNLTGAYNIANEMTHADSELIDIQPYVAPKQVNK